MAVARGFPRQLRLDGVALSVRSNAPNDLPLLDVLSGPTVYSLLRISPYCCDVLFLLGRPA